MSKQARGLRGEVERLMRELQQARWDLAHYRDLYLLACGVTAAQLAPLSSVLRLEREENEHADPR